MTAEHIRGIDVVIDETMRAVGHTSHRLAGVSDAEVLTVAVVAAAFGLRRPPPRPHAGRGARHGLPVAGALDRALLAPHPCLG